MLKNIIVFFVSQEYLVYVLFAPLMTLSFVAGLISLIRGISRRWT